MLISIPVAVVLAGLVTENRPVEKFHALNLSGGITATVHRGAQPALKLTGSKEALERLETVVEDGTLIIRRKRTEGFFNFGTRSDSISADITVTELDSIKASGGTEIRGDGLLGSKCEIDVSGGVELDLKGVACEALVMEASGGAEVKLKGATKLFDVDASGGVELDTWSLKAQEAKVEASGGVTGKVAVVETLHAKLSGGASVAFKGDPKVREVKASGAASHTFEN